MDWIAIDSVKKLSGDDLTVCVYVSETACSEGSRQQGSAWLDLVRIVDEVMSSAPARSGELKVSFLRRALPKTLHVVYENLTGTVAASLLTAVADVPSVRADVEGGGLAECTLVRWSR